MNENINDFFTTESKERIRIGDYYYNDGTLSHEYQKTKKCIGIVFCTKPFLFGEGDFLHGSVVALEDANDGNGNLLHLWCRGVDNVDTLLLRTKNKQIDFIRKTLIEDYGGLFYTKNLFDVDYEAVNAARNFSVNLPDGKTSGWYLPSSGQMWQIANRFFHNDEFVVQKSLLNLADKYIVSQPREIVCPLCLDLKERQFSYGNTDERFLVRPVFSF